MAFISSSEIYFSKFSSGSKALKDCPKLKHQAICLNAICRISLSLPGASSDCNSSVKLLLSFTMLPHILRASHHRSYDWLSLNDNRIEMAVPKNVGMEIGISGIYASN